MLGLAVCLTLPLQVNHTNEQENLTDELFLPLVAALAKYDTVSGEGEVKEGKARYVVLFKPDSEREKEWVGLSRRDTALPGLIVFQVLHWTGVPLCHSTTAPLQP